MKKYIKPSADVVELAFSGNIAALTPGSNVYDGSISGTSTNSGANLFANDVNGLNTSGDDTSTQPEDEEASE